MPIGALRPPVTAQAAEPEALGIMPANWPALRVFLNLGTQWCRAGADGAPVGLDYAVVPVVAGMLAVPADSDLLARLRVLEAEALRVMRAEAERERERRRTAAGRFGREAAA